MSRQPTTLLTARDIGEIVRRVGRDALMDELITRLAQALSAEAIDRVDVRKRDGFTRFHPTPRTLEWMPAFERGGDVLIKVVNYNPENRERAGLPTIISTSSLYDAETGVLLCLSDAALTTAMRTGAASAIATRILARDDSTTLGLIGCGVQSVTQAHALSRVLPLKQILAYDVDERAAASLPERLAWLHVPVSIVSRAELEARADVICTATSVGIGDGPVLDDRALKPHLHVNAVGSDLPGKIELPRSMLSRSLVCPDYLPQAAVEGECQQLEPAEVGPSLAELVQSSASFAPAKDRWTVFDSTGYALEDLVAMSVFLGYARSFELGQQLVIEGNEADVLDPYAISRSAPVRQKLVHGAIEASLGVAPARSK